MANGLMVEQLALFSLFDQLPRGVGGPGKEDPRRTQRVRGHLTGRLQVHGHVLVRQEKLRRRDGVRGAPQNRLRRVGEPAGEPGGDGPCRQREGDTDKSQGYMVNSTMHPLIKAGSNEGWAMIDRA